MICSSIQYKTSSEVFYSLKFEAPMKTKFIKVFDDNYGSWELINSRNVVLIVVRNFKFNEDDSDTIELASASSEVFHHEIDIYALNNTGEVVVHQHSTMKSNYRESPDDELSSFITEFEENAELCDQFLIAKEMDGLGRFYLKKNEITVISGYERMDEKGGLYFCSNIETTLMGKKLGDKTCAKEINTDFLEYPIFASQSPDELIVQLES